MTRAVLDENASPLHRRMWRSRRLYLFIAPTILLLLTFSYWPAISSLYHAFYRWRPFGESDWVGLENFRTLYHGLFQPVEALSSDWSWFWVQFVGWGVSLAAGVVFVLGDWLAKYQGRWRTALVGGLWYCAVTSVLISAVTGAAEMIGGEVTWLLAHAILAVLLVLQFFAWRRYWQSGKGLGRFGLCTALAIGVSVWLLIHFSQAKDGAYLRDACWNLVRLMSFQLTIGLFMPLLIAEILFHLQSERFKYVYRVLFVIPMVVPGMVNLLMWQFIYDHEYGLLNNIIRSFHSPPVQFGLAMAAVGVVLYLLMLKMTDRVRRGLGRGWPGLVSLLLLVGMAGVCVYWIIAGAGQPVTAFTTEKLGISAFWQQYGPEPQAWLSDAKIALYSIMLMGFPWVGTISMLIFYAGLQAIPTSVLESARLDGATGLKRFFTVDFPMILGQFKLLLILGVINGIQGFQHVLVLTYGGPSRATDMPGLRMYQEGYEYGRLGYGTTIGVAMFLLILVLTFVNMRYIRPSQEEVD